MDLMFKLQKFNNKVILCFWLLRCKPYQLAFFVTFQKWLS